MDLKNTVCGQQWKKYTKKRMICAPRNTSYCNLRIKMKKKLFTYIKTQNHSPLCQELPDLEIILEMTSNFIQNRQQINYILIFYEPILSKFKHSYSPTLAHTLFIPLTEMKRGGDRLAQAI
jgi:hypothetical protein